MGVPSCWIATNVRSPKSATPISRAAPPTSSRSLLPTRLVASTSTSVWVAIQRMPTVSTAAMPEANPESASVAWIEGDPLAHGIPRGNVPRHEDWHLGHDAAGEIVSRGEAGELLQRIGHEARLLQATLAVCTLPYVCLEGCNAKTLLAIEEQIELSWK